MESSPPPSPQWRKCTTCKKPIGFAQKYWICSVSTCNRQRTGLVFCSVSCFDAHIPVMNHRDAGAFEKRAPTEAEWKRDQAAAQAPAAPTPRAPGASGPTSTPAAPRAAQGPGPASNENPEDEVLVVVSKVKAYIRERSGMNTSDSVMRLLSQKIRQEMKDAIRHAAQEDRKTVLDRDCRE
jgi:hypothetical protein